MSTARRLLLPLTWTAAIGGVLWYVNSLRHSVPFNLAVILTGGAVITLIIWNFQALSERVQAAQWHVRSRRTESAPPLQLDFRLVRLRRDVRDTVERNDRPDALREHLKSLTAARLRASLGLDLETDREAARVALSPRVYDYLCTAPTTTAPISARLLQTVIDRIETL